MVKYRLKFKIQRESEVGLNRDNNINSILSEIEDVVSNEPIRKPLKDEIVLVNGEEYKVDDVLISFEKEGDTTYYDFIINLVRKIKDKKGKDLIEEYIEDMYNKYDEELKRQRDIYKKYDDYTWTDWNDKFKI